MSEQAAGPGPVTAPPAGPAHRLAEAYTDAPSMHPNPVLGTLQIFVWLLFHPSAWRSYVARADPSLQPDFFLSQLTPAQWRNPMLRRLLFRGHVVGPLLVGLLLLLELWALGVPPRHIAVRVAACLIMGVLGGVFAGSGSLDAVGMAVGVVGSLSGAAAFALAVAVTGRVVFPQEASVAAMVRDFLAGGPAGVTSLMVAFGVSTGALIVAVGGAATSVSRKRAQPSRRHPVGRILVGLVGGGIAFGVALGAAIYLPFRLGVAAGGLYAGFAAGLWTMRRFGWGVVLGLSCALFNYVMVNIVTPAMADVVVVGIVVGLILGYWFSVPYVLAEDIGGPLAGNVAGSLGLSGGWLLMLSSASKQHVTLGTSVLPGLLSMQLGLLLGLTQHVWRPLLLFPFEEAWNLLLFRMDQSRSGPGGRPSWLRWHAAFWDELQRWPLYGLDDHVLMVLERDPEEGRRALEYLAWGHQRWAVQAVQIESDARRLERCADAEAIGQVHRSLATEELEGPASALWRGLRSISQDVDAALSQSTNHNQRLGLSAVQGRLESLLGELDRSGDRYARRLRPSILRWRQIVTSRAQALADAAELSQELDNPYVIGVPLTVREEIFVGRTDISARIEQILLDRRRHPLLLHGQRRMGKTSLLHNLGRLLPSTIVPLFVDLQGPASSARDHAGLLYNLARGMTDSARKQRGLSLPPLTLAVLAADPFTLFDEWLDQVEGALGASTALLLFDELEALDQALEAGRFSETQVLGMLRHIIQHRPRFKTLLATSRSLEELTRWSSYLINVQVVQVGYLREEEARRLIERPIPNAALRYEPEATRRVLALTRGHPFLVQLLCAEIVELKNEQDPAVRRLATAADVADAVPQALSHGSFFFADIERNQVDEAGRAVLRLLAARGEGRAASVEELRAACPSDPGAVLDHLLRRDLLEPCEAGFRFQVELIRSWFAHSLAHSR